MVKSKKERQYAFMVIGKLIGYKLANSRFVSKGVNLVQNISSCYSMTKPTPSSTNENENCSKENDNKRTKDDMHANSCHSKSTTNSNINATQSKSSGSKRPTHNLNPSGRKAGSRRTLARCARCDRKRKLNKNKPDAKGNKTGRTKKKTRRSSRHKTGNKTPKPSTSCETLKIRFTRSAAEKDQPTTSGIPRKRKGSKEQILVLSKTHTQKANKDSKHPSQAHRTSIRQSLQSKACRASTTTRIQGEIPTDGITTAPLNQDLLSTSTTSNEQEWPALSKTTKAGGSSSNAPKAASPYRRWADIVSRHKGTRGMQQLRPLNALHTPNSQASQRVKPKKSATNEQEKVNSTNFQRQVSDTSNIDVTNSLDSASTSRSKKTVDKHQSKGALLKGGKPQSLRLYRRLYGNDVSKSKKDILKDKHCLKRQQQDGLSSSSNKHSLEKTKKAPMTGINPDNQHIEPGDQDNWKIDNMSEVITQPAGEEFSLRESRSRNESKKETSCLTTSNRHAPGTSKIPRSSHEEKLRLDLSEHLNSMSIGSPNDTSEESSSNRRSLRKIEKRKSKYETNQKSWNTGRSKLGSMEAGQSKDNTKKGQTENTQLKVSKKYRALLRGNLRHLDVKKVTEMTKRRPRTTESPGRAAIKWDDSQKRKRQRAQANSSIYDQETNDNITQRSDDSIVCEAGKASSSNTMTAIDRKVSNPPSSDSEHGDVCSNENSNHLSLTNTVARYTANKKFLPPTHVQSVPNLARYSIPFCIELNATDSLDLNWWRAFLQQPLHP